MKIDIHCHAIGKGKNPQEIDQNVYFNIDDDPSLFTRAFYKVFYNTMESNLVSIGADTRGADGLVSTDEYFDYLYWLLGDSKEIDGMVLLAFDAVYGADGKIDLKTTDLWVSNRFLNDRVTQLNEKLEREGKSNKKFFFGASVNPNNREWEQELDFVLKKTDAVLIKWIPSVQHIQVQNVPSEYYGRLADAEMPLLSHVGPEHTFPEGMRKKEYDHFKHLQRPLDEGVRVIAAHCNTPSIPLLEKNEIGEFYNFMKHMNRNGAILFSDTSALTSITKFRYIKKIADTFDPNWLVHGSDFPIPVTGWVNIPYVNSEISPDEYLAILQTKNVLDLDVLVKRAHGLSDQIIENAEKVIRL